MANQPETSTYEAGVYQLETTDPVQGGVGGVSNTPLLQLASRTKWLKDWTTAAVAGFTSGILRATTKLTLRTQAGADGIRAVFRGIGTGATRGGFRVHAFNAGEAEASEAPNLANALFGGERNDAGDGADFYFGGPGGIEDGLTSGQHVDWRVGGGTDWLVRFTYDGTRRLVKFLSQTLAERLSLYDDGRLLLRRSGDPLLPTLTVRRRIPVTAGVLVDGTTGADASSNLSWNAVGPRISAPGGGNSMLYKVEVPEAFDVDGVVLELAAVDITASSVAGSASCKMRRCFDLETAAPAEGDASNSATWGALEVDEKTLTMSHTASEAETVHLLVTVPAGKDITLHEALAVYKAHRLPA